MTGDWRALYKQVQAFREACGEAHLKTILGTGELATLNNVAKASVVCMLAGADFIKTSTGKEKVNANLQTSLAMIRMIRDFNDETGVEIGYKPAGGIASPSGLPSAGSPSRRRFPDDPVVGIQMSPGDSMAKPAADSATR